MQQWWSKSYLYKEDVYSSAVDIDLPEELPERNINWKHSEKVSKSRTDGDWIINSVFEFFRAVSVRFLSGKPIEGAVYCFQQ